MLYSCLNTLEFQWTTYFLFEETSKAIASTKIKLFMPRFCAYCINKGRLNN